MCDNILDSIFNDCAGLMNFFRVTRNDTRANREAILKTSKLCYWYCRYVKNKDGVRDGITESNHAYWYCRYVTHDEEVAGRIVDPVWVDAYLAWRIRIEKLVQYRQDVDDGLWCGSKGDMRYHE